MSFLNPTPYPQPAPHPGEDQDRMSPCPLVGAFPEFGIGPRADPVGAAMAPMASEVARWKP